MDINSVDPSNPYAGSVKSLNISPGNIGAINAINTPQPVQQPIPLRPSEIVAGSEARISNPGQLVNANDHLLSAALALILPGVFVTQTVTSSAPSIVTGTAKGVTPGNYAVEVTQLAQAQTLVSTTQTSPFTPIGSGAATVNFAFANGTTRSVPIAANDNNLAAISAAINQARIGVTARVLVTSEGAQLQLTGQTGAANAFTVNTTGNAALSQLISTATEGGLSQVTSAQNAQGSVNGIAFTSSSNAVFTAIPGLALNLNAVGSAALNVAPATVNTNDLRDFLNALNQFRESLQQFEESSPLLDQSRPSLQAELDHILAQSQPALAAVGVTLGPSGGLSFDEELFRAALTGNPAAVAQVFSNHGFGFAERILNLIENTLPLSPLNLLQLAAPAAEMQGEQERLRESSPAPGGASLDRLI